MADVPVMELSTTVSVRTVAGRRLENTTSLANYGIFASCTVIPEYFRKAVPALANGVREPPITATLISRVMKLAQRQTIDHPHDRRYFHYIATTTSDVGLEQQIKTDP